MELNTATLSDFTKLGDVLWLKGLESVPKYARSSGLFKEVPVSKNSGSSREFSEIDVEEYANRKEEGDQSSRANIQQGYSKTMTKYRVSKDVGITYEMRTENKYPEVIARLTGLGYQVANRMELDLTHRITFASAVAYTDMDGVSQSITVGDGLALASAVHTVRGSGVTYRNILANNPRPSKGALEGMERLCIENTVNQFGEKKGVPHDIIWTTDEPNNVNFFKEYLNSTGAPDYQNSAVKNVYMTKYKLVVLPLIATTAAGLVDTTKRYYWGLASSTMSSAFLGIWEEPHLKKAESLNAGEDFATDNWNFGARGGYGIAVVSANWFKISYGDATA